MNHPHRGSMQFWPRKRARHSIARVRSWPVETKTKPLAFIGYKAGMTHIQVKDTRAKSPTKGEKISLPTTIIECPALVVVGIAWYKQGASGWQKIASTFVEKPSPHLAKRVPLSKKAPASLTGKEFDELRLLVHTQPHLSSVDAKKPHLQEIPLGGSKEEKLKYAQQKLGQEISIKEIFEAGKFIDVHGITKGKGFQGTVKRFGVPIRQHKAEKTKRGIATLGSWHPNRVQYTVPQSGKMGFHLRTEYNKQILKIGENGQEVTPKGGLSHYGLVKNNYLLIKGSVPGPQKRAVLLTAAIRPDRRLSTETFEINYIHI